MIVADTHVLLWWFGGEKDKLSVKALAALEAEREEGLIYVSSITAWEIGLLLSKKRIGLLTDALSWLGIIDRLSTLHFVPVDNEIAVRSTQLGKAFHKDPADRIIVATCHKFDAPLVTADSKIRAYPNVVTIW